MIDDMDIIAGLGTPAVTQADGDLGPGVVVTPATQIGDGIQLAVANVLAGLPPDAHGAIVGIATREGLNLAFAYRVGKGFEVGAWVGKSGWTQPLGAGVTLRKVF